MISINTKTGGALSSSSVTTGELWVERGKEITEEQNEEVIETKSGQIKNQDDKSAITKRDIMQELSTFKIEYDSKMTRDELLKLLQG